VGNDNNTLCLSCHATHGPFEGIQKAWVMNPTLYHDSIGAVVKQHDKHNIYDPLNALNTGGSGRCSKCHLTKTATTAKSYDIHSHTFAVISPAKTLQYSGVSSPTLGMLNSCAASCHRNPSGSTSTVPTFGIPTDSTLTNWKQGSDLALADTLFRYWQLWGWTGVKEIANLHPSTYYLSQNYPNPFNPSTKITVDLPVQSNVRLVVYNLLGEQVATLMNGSYDVGKYEVTWLGKDDNGLQTASGVYIYRLEAGTFSVSKKMLMMK
jgi:hypothetical protein